MRFKLQFSGRILDGRDPERVRRQLGELLKLDEAGLDQLFSGRNITLKRGLERTRAISYQRVLSQAGAEVRMLAEDKVEPAKVAAPAPDPADDAAVETEYLQCPRCAHSQPLADACMRCKMDLRRYLMRLQRRAQNRPGRNRIYSAPL